MDRTKEGHTHRTKAEGLETFSYVACECFNWEWIPELGPWDFREHHPLCHKGDQPVSVLEKASKLQPPTRRDLAIPEDAISVEATGLSSGWVLIFTTKDKQKVTVPMKGMQEAVKTAILAANIIESRKKGKKRI